MVIALRGRQSLKEVQTWWSDEDIATALQLFDDEDDAHKRG